MESKNFHLWEKIKNDRKLTIKFQIIQQIGVGCFGTVYKAKNLKTNKYVALKVQIIQKNLQTAKSSSLANQITILDRLKNVQGTPKIHSVGKWDYGVYIELQLLLSSLNEQRKKNYSYPEMKSLAIQMLQILRRIHSKGIVHQDLKPQNIMRNSNGNLVLIDFGLSAIFNANGINGKANKKKGFIGTPRYASLTAHKGYSQMPKDDIESMLYVLGTLYLKKAPWFQLKAPVSQRLQTIQKYKRIHNKEWFRRCGKQFYDVYEHLQSLQSKQWPDYSYLINLFQHHRDTVVIHQKKDVQLEKQRRKSDCANLLLDLPIIQIHYAEKKTPELQIQTDNKIEHSRSNNSFSLMAHDGLQMIQLLTEKILKFNENIQEQPDPQFDTSSANCSSEPHVVSLLKYPQLSFKNPFCT